MQAKKFLLLASCVFIQPFTVEAAKITLSNGDVITGEIIERLEDGSAIIQHDVLGKISVQKAEIASVASDEEIAEKVKEASEDRPDSFTLEGAAQLADGNTNRKLYNLQADYETRIKKNRYTLSADLNYGQSEGEEDVNNNALLAKYDYFYAEKWYWFSSLDYYSDDFQDIKNRVSFASGLGHQFIDNDISNVRFELGPSIVYEKTDNDENTFMAGRWMLKAEHKLLPGRLHAFHRQTGLLSFEDTQDVSVRAETGIKLPIYEGWHGFAQMNNNWEGAPVDDREAFDTTYLLGIGYGW